MWKNGKNPFNQYPKHVCIFSLTPKVTGENKFYNDNFNNNITENICFSSRSKFSVSTYQHIMQRHILYVYLTWKNLFNENMWTIDLINTTTDSKTKRIFMKNKECLDVVVHHDVLGSERWSWYTRIYRLSWNQILLNLYKKKENRRKRKKG